MKMKWTVGSVLVAGLALGAVACGGSADNTLTNEARDRLGPLVAQVRSRAEGYDPYGALLALHDVRTAVADLRHTGAIGESRADAIRASIDEVGQQLEHAPTTTTTTTTTTLPPLPPPAAAEDRGHGDDNGKGNGQGKGGKGKD
jgi:hypothetical protein